MGVVERPAVVVVLEVEEVEEEEEELASSSRRRAVVRWSMRVSSSGTATYGRVRSNTSWVEGVRRGK